MPGDPVEDGLIHEVAAREYARNYLRVHDARAAMLSLARLDAIPGAEIDGDDFITAINRYQSASEAFCFHQDQLNEAQSADPRPTCVFCHKRLDREEVPEDPAAIESKTWCSAQNRVLGRPQPHKIKEDE